MFPHEIAARRKREKAEREKKAKHARRTAMGPHEIAAGLAAAATPTATPRRRGRPPGPARALPVPAAPRAPARRGRPPAAATPVGNRWTRTRAAAARNRPPTPPTPANVLQAVGLVPVQPRAVVHHHHHHHQARSTRTSTGYIGRRRGLQRCRGHHRQCLPQHPPVLRLLYHPNNYHLQKINRWRWVFRRS